MMTRRQFRLWAVTTGSDFPSASFFDVFINLTTTGGTLPAMSAVSEFLPQLLELGQLVRLEIHSEPSAGTAETLGGFEAVIYSTVDGFAR